MSRVCGHEAVAGGSKYFSAAEIFLKLLELVSSPFHQSRPINGSGLDANRAHHSPVFVF